MNKNLGDIIRDILVACQESLKSEFPAIKAIPVELEMPKDKNNGDLSTNLAFKLSRQLGGNPQEIAKILIENLKSLAEEKGVSELLDNIEIKSAGFINFWFSKKYLYGVLEEIEKNKEDYGRINVGKGKKIHIEFVSANPTGPLTIAHGRQAAVGDSLANILKAVNYKVQKEYYINDEGTQIEILGRSIMARYMEALGMKGDFPDNGYKGRYIYDIAKEIQEKYGDKNKDADLNYFIEFGVKVIMKTIEDDLEDFNVKFDVWYSQKSLTQKDMIKKVLETLKKDGYLYDKDGALWFSSQNLGDDKDRVVIKSNGSYTYLAPDIAYHDDKFKRGFEKLINIWGPDHHGYIPRLKAAVKALGYNPDDVSIVIIQLATLYRGNEVVPMSTREGQFVTLREVINEVGRDAGRFFFLMRKTDSHLDFDLELAKKTSLDNPVYYIQYAHARIANILDFAKDKYPNYNTTADPALLNTEEEIDILKHIRKLPYVLAAAAESLEPYFVVLYVQNLAALFHRFYTKHRVVTDDEPLSRARLELAYGVKTVLARCLSLLGVSAPTNM
ncbi:MAG: arginine--tRNA ligase [Candidatus Omnitrophica bacterium CG07_land_8_20_14_0_80_42_15]|uniref:Arginine--tRNA ligase n=1 Tax=Candidatus Aquitaenariimonas noxiae TaxID=1974741 RepID=A0A2J0KSN1_9BACT|nr:MAG: arginine--tRNA ligase [Candidatus Omnitrophica bacterium CG07_land_8_20_14_0_80_42_15]